MAEPTATPVTTPLLFTLAIDALLLDHVPPIVMLLSEVVPPTYVLVEPDIDAGVGETVATAVAKQPVGKV
jgi:hypothetical protein